MQTKNPRLTGGFSGGSDRHRSGDLSIFSRTLYQLSYRAEASIEERRLLEKKPSIKKGFSSATLTGLEPATSAVTGRHANQLRYRASLFSVISVVALAAEPLTRLNRSNRKARLPVSPQSPVTPTGFEPVLPP